MSGRKKIATPVETELLTLSARRCCLCFGVNHDYNEKNGQIAHLDQNPANNSIENLAWLCLDHHDKYDGKTSQSKGYTEAEVKKYRKILYKKVEESRGHSSSSIEKEKLEPKNNFRLELSHKIGIGALCISVIILLFGNDIIGRLKGVSENQSNATVDTTKYSLKLNDSSKNQTKNSDETTKHHDKSKESTGNRTNYQANTTIYNGPVAQNMTINNYDSNTPEKILNKIKANTEHLPNQYTELLTLELSSNYFQELKKIAINICDEFEMNQNSVDINPYQNNIYLIGKVLLVKFPYLTLSDSILKTIMVKYNGWLFFKMTKSEKLLFQNEFIRYLKEAKISKNKDIIFSLFSLIELDKEFSENYDLFKTNLGLQLTKEKIQEILKIGKMQQLRRFQELKKDFL